MVDDTGAAPGAQRRRLPETQPRWLSDAEQEAWRAFLAFLTGLEDRLDRQLQRDAGMPHAYYQVLAMLSEAPGRTLRMSELAVATTSSPSRLSHAVARLEEKGWVRRDRHPTDRRGSLAVLTDAGYTALVAAAPGHVEAVREALFDRLTPTQVRQLRDVFRALADDDSPGRGTPAG